jgi:uncharacterized protein YggU (UPF0235/DUF167 family)
MKRMAKKLAAKRVPSAPVATVPKLPSLKCTLRVHVKPGAKPPSCILSVEKDASPGAENVFDVEARVSARAVEGQANEALVELLEESLGTAVSREHGGVSIVAGHKSRVKTFSATAASSSTEVFAKLVAASTSASDR